MKKSGNKKQKLFIVTILIVGLLILFYPMYSNYINQRLALRTIENYDSVVNNKTKKQKDRDLEKAYNYNRKLVNEKVPDSFAKRMGIKHDKRYEEALNVINNGMMGVIEIPSIAVKLPIYHYTTKEILEKGAGHLFGSSLPAGGKSTHAVITAHRGLPSAKMFTDLDQLRKGDEFFIHVLGNKLAYKIDRMKTVKPDETAGMGIEKGKDYVTLITCTPYGKNTHRLLVRGHRVPYHEGDENKQIHRKHIPWMHIFFGVVGILATIFCYGMIVFVKKRNLRKNHNKRG